jgi:hypothetical protein
VPRPGKRGSVHAPPPIRLHWRSAYTRTTLPYFVIEEVRRPILLKLQKKKKKKKKMMMMMDRRR